jgi:hypothetical protein
MSEHNEDVLTDTETIEDFSTDRPKDEVKSPKLNNEAYDPRPHEDNARRWIAYFLICLLSVTVVGILLLLGFEKVSIDQVSEFGVILSPLIALVSAATGFYYGTKSNALN